MKPSSVSPIALMITFAALVGLTLLTVALSFLRLGPWHLAVGLGIGVLKAAIVGMFFMHLVHARSRTWLAAGVGVFWLGILVVLMMSDYLTRSTATF